MSPSPGPTLTMRARQVRMGDVLFVDDEPHAVTGAVWEDGTVVLFLEGYADPWTFLLDDELDVTRPPIRHAETGDHDL